MKKVLLCLILLLSLFIVTGCGKENKSASLTYSKPEAAKSEKKDSGTLDETEKKWDSISYTFDNMIITIKHYEDVEVEGLVSEGFEDKTIKGINYKYKEVKVDEEYVSSQYYTQVDKDAYFIISTYIDNDTNKKIINDLLESVVKKK